MEHYRSSETSASTQRFFGLLLFLLSVTIGAIIGSWVVLLWMVFT